MSRVFIDTNIVLDLLIEDRKNHDKSKQLFSYLILNNYEIVISEDMLSTIFYVAKNKDKTLNFFQEIQDEWVISAYGKDVLSNSFTFALENSADLEDTLQCFCAKENGCEQIITSDKKFVLCGIKIATYDDFGIM